MNLPNKYIAIDIETTDSDYRNGDIIQIGAVVVNEDLSLGETFETFLTPLTDYRNPIAMEANKISEKDLETAPTLAFGLEKFDEFCAKIGKKPLLAAWGTYFDVTFLKETYRKIGREYPFSYRCLDLKSIAIWEMAKRGQSASGGVETFLKLLNLEFEGTPHSALDDIKNTLRILQNIDGPRK